MKTFFKQFIYISSVCLCMLLTACGSKNVSNATLLERAPKIDPDYTNAIIPPNIAPLNFLVDEAAAEFYVKIYGDAENAASIEVSTKKIVDIPINAWKKLLQANQNKNIYFDVYAQSDAGEWQQFQTITNKVAGDSIDSHVAYRLINPGYELWWEMGIYQRDIQTFHESPIFTNRVTNKNCMNCHAFCKNDPNTLMFHMRAANGGTIIAENGHIQKIDTKTDYTMSAGVYAAWHPDGRHIAYSVNKITQNFHAHQDKSIFVKDSASDLIVYDVETNTVTTCPQISTKRLENLPTWSPDGKYLYFISGDPWRGNAEYEQIKYDLMRIAYDVQNKVWGKVEPVLLASQTGKSISFPTISPDGKYLLFCMSDYGYFTIHFPSSDLYMMDLSTGEYQRLDINSESVESYHSWSSNSRWFVFVGKNRDGLCSRLYFSYVDAQGKAYKPVLLPQKDPRFYDTFIKNYNKPEMITGAVTVSEWDIQTVAKQPATAVQFDKTVQLDALSGATRFAKK